MYEIETEDILKAQNKSEEALTKLVKTNSRISLEYSKKIFWKRACARGFISNRLYRFN